MQSGERELITVIEGVSAGGVVLPPMIIYRGKSHSTGWYTYVDGNVPAVFAYSDKGWTDNELWVEYLEKVFEPGTAKMYVDQALISSKQKANVDIPAI